MESMSISAIILAGGESRRLGTKKHLLQFGGKTLVQIIIERLANVSDDVMVVTSAQEVLELDVSGARVIADQIPGRGPLSGLHAGLLAATSDRALLVACDMPFLSVPLLRHLSQPWPNTDAVAPEITGNVEPLLAVYSRSCLPAVEDLLTIDRASMRDLLQRVDTYLIPEEEVRSFDPSGLSWFNLNTQEDVDRARYLGRKCRPLTELR